MQASPRNIDCASIAVAAQNVTSETTIPEISWSFARVKTSGVAMAAFELRRKLSSRSRLRTNPHLVRIDRHQIAFLLDKIYRQNVVLPHDNHKIRRRATGDLLNLMDTWRV